MNTFKKSFTIAIVVLFFLSNGGISIAENIDKLISDLDRGDLRTRLSAVEELGRIRDEKSIDLLMNVADTSGEAWKIKTRAIRLLGEIGNAKAVDLLTKIFNDPFLNHECPAIKWNAAIALGNFKKNPRVTHTLINGLEDDNLVIREGIIQSLGKTGDPKAVPLLISLLQDKSFAIRMSAIKSLGEIGDHQAISPLKHIVDNDDDPYMKNEALSALKNIPVQKD